MMMTPYLLLPVGSEMETLMPVLLPSDFQEPSVGYHVLEALALQPFTVALVDAINYTFLKNSLPAVAVEGRLVPYWLELRIVAPAANRFLIAVAPSVAPVPPLAIVTVAPNFAMVTELSAIFAVVTAESAILAVSTAAAPSFAAVTEVAPSLSVVTAPEAKAAVPTAPSAILAAVTASSAI